jgi:hypothetical protein
VVEPGSAAEVVTAMPGAGGVGASKVSPRSAAPALSQTGEVMDFAEFLPVRRLRAAGTGS